MPNMKSIQLETKDYKVNVAISVAVIDVGDDCAK